MVDIINYLKMVDIVNYKSANGSHLWRGVFQVVGGKCGLVG